MVFRIYPEFRILRLTFHRKSASKCWIRQTIIASLISFQIIYTPITCNHLNLKFFIFVGILQVLKFGFLKFRILEILNFPPWSWDLCTCIGLKLLCPTVWEEIHLQENSLYDLWVKVTLNIAQYPLHHAATKYKVATSNGTFTRKHIIWPWPSQEMLRSTLYIMWPMQLQSLKLLRQIVKEEIHLQEKT